MPALHLTTELLAQMLRTTEKWKDGEPFQKKGCLLPTVLAMKTLPSYEDRGDEEIEAELRLLAGEVKE